jgi:glycine/D-amino acid oxidase-like deaminating enzyme
MRHGDSATHQKDLRTGNSLWTIRKFKRQPLKDSIRADVAIVGAGVSGAFMAQALAKQFENVVVLDRRAPAEGSTTASTAMLQWEIDIPLTELSEKIGPTKAMRAWRRSFRATQALQRLVGELQIVCELSPRSSLYLTGDRLGSRAMLKESRARHRAKLPGEYLDVTQLREMFGIDRTGAIFSPGSAGANPVKLTRGLLRHAKKLGAKMFWPVEVEDVIATKHGVILDSGEHFIEAKYVVFCTGYELLKGIPENRAKITSSWAVATRPRVKYPRWLDEVLIWEAAEPYLYMRTTPDGRLIAGGEDEDIDLPSYRARSLERKSSRIVKKVETLIPDIEFSPVHEWSGAFGESLDGLPFIDAVPDMPNCFVVMGFGGNGTIYSKIASEIVPTLIKGRADKDADIFRFR